MPIQPRVFISHSSADKDFVEFLVGELQSRGVSAWMDRRELGLGDSIVAGIEDGLADTDYFLIVLTPESVMSPWVRVELNAATYDEIEGGGTRILPILLKDCEIPPLLRDRISADFRASFEEGIKKVLEVLGLEDAEIHITIRKGKSLGLQEDISVHCDASKQDCIAQLDKYSLGDLERLLFHRLETDQLRRAYFNLFEGNLEDLGLGRSKEFLTSQFLVKVKQDGLRAQLQDFLCSEYSKKMCP